MVTLEMQRAAGGPGVLVVPPLGFLCAVQACGCRPAGAAGPGA